MNEKKLLFSITANDCDFEVFCTGGNGGQHRNAKKNGVRVRHRASGAVGEHRDGRDQYRNRHEAFRKMAESDKFKSWHRAEVARRLGIVALATEDVERGMLPEHIKIEVRDTRGLWQQVAESQLLA